MSLTRTGRYACVLVLIAFVGACGSDPASTPAPSGSTGFSKDNPVSIKVGDVEGAPASFLKFGIQKGFFANRGLNIQLVAQQGGAAIVPGLASGELQIGGSNAVSMLLARDRGLPVQIIAPGTSVGTDPDKDFSAVIVAKDSPIVSAKDLAGKNIAVNTLKNVNEIVLKSHLESIGVDVNSLKYTELGFPDMLAAVNQKHVDAAAVIEPFATIALGQGARVLFRPYVSAKANLAVGTYSASESYIKANPAVINVFRAAAAQTGTHIASHPDEYRAALPTIANIAPELAPKVNIPNWSANVDVSSLEFFADRMVRYGLVKTKPDVAAAVYKP